jgi:hypothetical protein
MPGRVGCWWGGVGYGVSVCPRCIIIITIITTIVIIITIITIITIIITTITIVSLVVKVFRLDEVASYQRSAVYSQRRAFLTSSDDGRPRTHIHTPCVTTTDPSRP